MLKNRRNRPNDCDAEPRHGKRAAAVAREKRRRALTLGVAQGVVAGRSKRRRRQRRPRKTNAVGTLVDAVREGQQLVQLTSRPVDGGWRVGRPGSGEVPPPKTNLSRLGISRGDFCGGRRGHCKSFDSSLSVRGVKTHGKPLSPHVSGSNSKRRVPRPVYINHLDRPSQPCTASVTRVFPRET